MGLCQTRCLTNENNEDDKFITRPVTYNEQERNSEDAVYNTAPPCWFNKPCQCDCHRGGKCVFIK